MIVSMAADLKWQARFMQLGMGRSSGKPCQHSCWWRWCPSEGVILPVAGVILEPHSCCTGFLGENPIRLQTSNGGAFDIVTSL
jgi:hypothetical protein